MSKGESGFKETYTTVMPQKDFDRYVRQHNTEVMYRGYSAASQEELATRTNELFAGTHRVSGDNTSASGKGLYFANNEAEAAGYSTRRQTEQGHGYGNVVTATLRKDAKIADQQTMNKLYAQKNDEASRLITEAVKLYRTDEAKADAIGRKGNEIRNMDIGSYAKLQGYDAIRTAFGETVVLNQSKLIYKKSE